MADLYEKISHEISAAKKFAPETIEIPKYILNNLKYAPYSWQTNALECLIYYENEKSGLKKNPSHLMFNMATGSGKTFLMGALILYYYKKGYRNFIFFVHRSNIVDKTENNFIDKNHTKYLFKDKIIIDDKVVNIRKVEKFSNISNNIEIKFTTIQKLYNDIHRVKENKVTLEELNSKNIVMLADEAHHLNTATSNDFNEQLDMNLKELKETSNKNEIEKKGWEHTVINLVFKKKGSVKVNKNILLEFTATIPEVESVAKKYKDKTIYKFALKEFLQAGYTKEINLISSTLAKKERVIQALLFQWYRSKISIKHNIVNFKPVVLFRSKTINESKEDFIEFINIVTNLSARDFNFFKKISDKVNNDRSIYEQGASRTKQLINFIKTEKITLLEIINWIKTNYKKHNIIITNSENNNLKKEKTDNNIESLLNNLEDSDNHIRAIFTVERLTEGWDVKNLFDIVRLYKGQNSGGLTRVTPEATIKEKQLIGRGVRYFPFAHNDKNINKRKFDNDLDNELRILEELFYYTYDENSRYISDLKEELRKDGYIDDNKDRKIFSLKKEFKESNFFKKNKIWLNKKIDNPDRIKKDLNEIKSNFLFYYKIRNFELTEEELDLDDVQNLEKLTIKNKSLKTITKKIKDFDKHLILKAINIIAREEDSIYRYENLKKEINLKCLNDLFLDKLSDFELNIIIKSSGTFDEISSQIKLNILIKFLNKFSHHLKENVNPHIGSSFFAKNLNEIFKSPKTKIINHDSESERIERELRNEDWYILDGFSGSSEEKYLIETLKELMGNLKLKYDEIYLLRNEEIYKIYDFVKGRGFQPDFILFLKSKNNNTGEILYQIFIEPKGDQLIELDKWKEKFLYDISEKYSSNNILLAENKKYKLIGLPFFNNQNKNTFLKKFNKEVLEV